MIWILVIFAVEQLKDLIYADEYFTEWTELSIVEEIGSLENQVEIYDVCKVGDGYYLVGGAVRYSDSGGMDAIVFYFNDGIEWYETFGGIRDEAFLSCYCDDSLYVSGYTYSPDFLGESTNFKTGFYLELDQSGKLIGDFVLPYNLDIMPTVIWKEGSIKVAGYLDNFGNTDIFIFDKELDIYSYSGQDRIFRKEGDLFLGSTTSKELGAVNRNLLEWNTTSYSVSPSDYDESYWYFDNLKEKITLEGIIYEDDITISKEGYLYTISRDIPILDCDELLTIQNEETVYSYCASDYHGNTYLFDVREYYKLINNISKETFYESFTLLFTGSGLLNGEEVITGVELGIGEYEFFQNGDTYFFEVVENDTDVITTTLNLERNPTKEEFEFNRKLIYLPIIIIANFLYKKYR